KLGGQRQAPSIVLDRIGAVLRARSRDLGPDAVGMGFIPSLPMGTGELEGALGVACRLVEPSATRVRLAEPRGPQRHVHLPGCDQRLLEEANGVREPSRLGAGGPE